MGYPVYTVPAGDVLPILFASYDGGTGASVTLTGLAVTDIEIYKDGGTTQRASDAGYTLLDTDGIDFDGVTGIHGFSIDTGDNTDAGFYTVGAWFHVVVSTVTVDAQTVSFIAAAFRLMPAESVAGKPKVDVDAFGGTAGTFASGRPEVNTTHFSGTAATASGGRPEVNTTHWGGTAVASATVNANATQISGDSAAADNLEAMLDGTGSVTLTTNITGNITGNLSGSVGSLTGHTNQTGDAFARLGAPVGASISADVAAVKSQTGAIETDTQDIQSRLPAALTANGNMKSDTLRINGTALTGDGSGTPWGPA